MATNTQMIAQAEIDLETGRGQFVALQLNPAVDDGTKLLAGAIAQAGAEIALAIARPARPHREVRRRSPGPAVGRPGARTILTDRCR